MILAEASGLETAGIISAIIVGGFSVIIATIALIKKQQVQVDQPVQVTITEELHKVFAAKEAFEQHVKDDKREHENLFSKIGGVDRGNGEKMSREVGAIHSRINGIEKSLGGLEKAAELQNQQMASLDAKITRILER